MMNSSHPASETSRLSDAGNSQKLLPGVYEELRRLAALRMAINLTVGSDATTAGLLNASSIALTLGGNLTVNFTAGTLVGGSFNLLDFGSQSGDFGSVVLTGNIAGALALTSTDTWTGFAGGYAFSFDETTGVLSFTSVPEPGEYAVAIAGMLTAMVVLRRRTAWRNSAI